MTGCTGSPPDTRGNRTKRQSNSGPAAGFAGPDSYPWGKKKDDSRIRTEDTLSSGRASHKLEERRQQSRTATQLPLSSRNGWSELTQGTTRRALPRLQGSSSGYDFALYRFARVIGCFSSMRVSGRKQLYLDCRSKIQWTCGSHPLRAAALGNGLVLPCRARRAASG